MQTQIITILCEGPHDVAFLTKILKTTGFVSHERVTLDEYPVPFNSFLINSTIKVNVSELNLQEVRQVLLPSNVLKFENTYLFLYSMGSISKVCNNQEILKSLLAFVSKEGEIPRLPQETKLGIVYFIDADNDGVTANLKKLNDGLMSIFNKVIFQVHNEIVHIDGVQLGNFIFTGDDGETGNLEDILIPLMKEGNEKIFEDAFDFLTYHSNNLENQRDYDLGKGTIGTVGQLQKSGMANAVIIGQTNYITQEKVGKSEKCQEINHFFSRYVEKLKSD